MGTSAKEKRRSWGMSMWCINVEDARDIPAWVPLIAGQAKFIRRVDIRFVVADPNPRSP